MSEQNWVLQDAVDETGEKLQQCDTCGDVILSMHGTTPKTCCGEEMTPVSETPTGRSRVQLRNPDHLLQSVLGIGQTAVEICFHVLQKHETTAKKVAEETGLDRSGVARHLNHLHELGLINKATKNLSDGGRIQVYSAPTCEEVQRHPQLLFFFWAADALRIFQRLNREKVNLLTGHQTRPLESIYWANRSTRETSDD